MVGGRVSGEGVVNGCHGLHGEVVVMVVLM